MSGTVALRIKDYEERWTRKRHACIDSPSATETWCECSRYSSVGEHFAPGHEHFGAFVELICEEHLIHLLY